ncbi:hypothetical protein DBR32_14465 [Taibaiella sp. KBW10]|uniref:hypothetical protein n=1 Tax=Taibaiella sp. KBW10 TaxID=2153357 RepID=UPI000F5ADD85|nr:hypothetical protein [Taibaiella sp. KBW10]RQO29785.1 hypothetical protein DBR32_14465 [Taibaiella sp. KBW10]
MKRFLKHTLWVLLPLIVLAYPLDRWLSARLKQSHTLANGEYLVWNDIYDRQINSELAIYGSSRAWRHFDPQILEDSLGMKAYNLGMDGYGFYLQYMRHLEYLKYNPKPKYIILSLDLFTFEMPKGLYNSGQFIPYMRSSAYMKQYLQPLQGFSVYDYYVPLLRYFGKKTELKEALKIGFKGEQQPALRTRGFAGNPESFNEDFQNAAKMIEKYTVLIDSPCVQLLHRFLSDCKKEDIQVIMVYSPQYTAIKQFLVGKEALVALYQKFAATYQIPFLDYSEDVLCFDQSNFYNTSHMNTKGATLFSQKLAHFLKRNTLLSKNLPVKP